MESTTTNLPAGLIDEGVEFFQVDKQINCLYNGRRYRWSEIPQFIKDMVIEDMVKNSEAIKALAKWDLYHEDEMLHQYILCRFGGFDNEPDISKDGNVGFSEYWDCGRRGTCANEGKLCSSIKVANGYLTKQQINILKCIRAGKTYAEIAEKLFIAEDTVISHVQNIQSVTGLKGKAELAAFAERKNLI